MEDATKPTKPKAKAWKDMNTTEKVGGGCAVFVFGFIALCILIAIWPETKKTPAEAKLAVETYSSEVMNAGRKCDYMSGQAGEAFGDFAKGRIIAATVYVKLQSAKTACEEAQTAVNLLEKPTGLNEKTKAEIEDASLACFGMHNAKVEGLGKAMEAINGDARPSVQAEFQQQMDRSKANTMGCLLALETAKRTVDEPDAVPEKSTK